MRSFQANLTHLAQAASVLQAEWPRAIQELVSFPHIEEAGVLSTCNRLELYVVALSWHRVSTFFLEEKRTCFARLRRSLGSQIEQLNALQGVREIEEWMSRSSGIPLETLRKHLFLYRDRDATSHLLR